MGTAVCSKSVKLQPPANNVLYEVRHDDGRPREICCGSVSQRGPDLVLQKWQSISQWDCFCMLRHSIYSTMIDKKEENEPESNEPQASPASISASSFSVSPMTFFSASDGSRYGLRGWNLCAEPPMPASLAE